MYDTTLVLSMSARVCLRYEKPVYCYAVRNGHDFKLTTTRPRGNRFTQVQCLVV